MALTSLKVSNVHEDKFATLISRLKRVESPGKKKLIEAIKNGDLQTLYTELLFRIELYTRAKVLNYTGADLKELTLNIYRYGTQPFVSALIDKTADSLNTDEVIE